MTDLLFHWHGLSLLTRIPSVGFINRFGGLLPASSQTVYNKRDYLDDFPLGSSVLARKAAAARRAVAAGQSLPPFFYSFDYGMAHCTCLLHASCGPTDKSRFAQTSCSTRKPIWETASLGLTRLGESLGTPNPGRGATRTSKWTGSRQTSRRSTALLPVRFFCCALEFKERSLTSFFDQHG